MTDLAYLEEICSIHIKNRINNILLFLKEYTVCAKHSRQRIPSFEKRLITTSCPRIVLNNLRGNGGKYGLLWANAKVLDRKIDSILVALRRTREIVQIFEQGLLKEYSLRFSTAKDAIYLTVSDTKLNGIDFGKFRLVYNWQTNLFRFEPIHREIWAYKNKWSFEKQNYYFHPLSYHLIMTGYNPESYVKANITDSSLVKILRYLIEALSGKRIDLSPYVNELWGPRKCRNCDAKIEKSDDIGRCDECATSICSSCEVLETWLDEDGEKSIFTICEYCALKLMLRK